MFSIPAIWEAVQLWQGWQRIGNVLKWLCAHPMTALALGLAVWGAIEHRAAAKWERQAKATLATLNQERATAQAAKRAYETQSKKDAEDADKNHTTLAAGGDGRFADYAADHGMPPNAPTHRSPGAPDNSTAIPENPSTDAILAEISRVWITRSDWLTCDADWAYAQAAHDWGRKVDGDQPH